MGWKRIYIFKFIQCHFSHSRELTIQISLEIHSIPCSCVCDFLLHFHASILRSTFRFCHSIKATEWTNDEHHLVLFALKGTEKKLRKRLSNLSIQELACAWVLWTVSQSQIQIGMFWMRKERTNEREKSVTNLQFIIMMSSGKWTHIDPVKTNILPTNLILCARKPKKHN